MPARTFLRLLGRTVGLIGVAWIVYQFARTAVVETLWQSGAFDRVAAFTVIAMPIYAMGLCCIGMAWWCVQAAFLPQRVPLRGLFAAYATTQFAKYLPGNVGHLVGRHVLLRRYGIQHHALVLATLIDAGALLLAALLPAASALQTLVPTFPMHVRYWQIAIIESIIVLGTYAVVQAWRRRNEKVAHWIPLHFPQRLYAVFPLQLIFFTMMTLALVLPAHVLLAKASDIWLLPVVTAASWMAGFLVVGAPAGLGVREVVFVALLKGHMPEQDIFLLAAIFRIITFGGDVLFLLLGLALGRGLP